jgi:hypothetical protein
MLPNPISHNPKSQAPKNVGYPYRLFQSYDSRFLTARTIRQVEIKAALRTPTNADSHAAVLDSASEIQV